VTNVVQVKEKNKHFFYKKKTYLNFFFFIQLLKKNPYICRYKKFYAHV